MSILSMWRGARGAVMRQEYEDAMARMKDANKYAKKAFFNNISQIADEMIEYYSSASTSERKTILREARKKTDELWRTDFWPEALGVGIVFLNAESRFVPGDDAAYVRHETQRLIEEAKDPKHYQTD